MKYEVTHDTMNKVLNYLANQRWQDVQPLIQALSQSKPIEEEKKEE